jgi:hypothetical protein
MTSLTIRYFFVCAGAVAFGASADARPPLLNDPVRLNIGYVCGWQVACIDKQHSAMRKAMNYLKRYDPPNWKIQQCNRNASRGRSRVDWIGYYNCIQNMNLKKRRSVRR